MEIHIITGPVVREVRAGQTKNNKDYTSFTISSEKSYQDKKFTSYHGFMAYGEEAKVAARLGVGDIVQVFSNEAKAEVYEKKETGEHKGSLNYTVRQIEVISAGGQKAAATAQPSRPSTTTTTVLNNPPAAPAQSGADEDVPF